MALNRTDTRQRAYNRIDTSQQQGNWIEEASYNKHGGGKILMGNWVEERGLKDGMAAHGEDSRVHRTTTTERSFGADRAKGGFQSSKFLTNPNDTSGHWALGQDQPHFVTVHQAEFNKSNADTSQRKPPPSGVLKTKRREEIMAEALASEVRPEQKFSSYSTSYQTTTALVEGPALRGPRDSFDYAEDVPVSLYTGNPETGKKMGVQGKSAGTGRCPFAKNAAFSTPIDKHPVGGKHQTPEY
eukprot:Hpha_TRINITY_DN16797_c5_g3::TRINITY_DN16797_c5_g3_i2::g.79028::m.79028